MTPSDYCLKDPIYNLLVGARDNLVNNFERTRLTYGDEVFSDVMKKMQEEHDVLKAEMDARIIRRIMQMADNPTE